MKLSRHSRIANLSKDAPVRRTMLPDGTILEEKVPSLPSRKLVGPDGNVREWTYVTGRTLGGHDDPDNAYGRQKLAEKRARGNLLYSECPYANGSLPTPDGVEPCKGIHPLEQEVVNEGYNWRKPPGPGNMPTKTVRLNERGAFWKLDPKQPRRYIETCCPHMEAIIAARKARHNEKQAEFAKAFEKPDEKLYRALVAKASEAAAIEPQPKARKRSARDALIDTAATEAGEASE